LSKNLDLPTDLFPTIIMKIVVVDKTFIFISFFKLEILIGLVI